MLDRDAGLVLDLAALPACLLWQLFLHQAECHLVTAQADQAQKCFNRAISALDKSELELDEREMEIMKIKLKLKTIKICPKPKSKSQKEKLKVWKKHQKYSSLSRSVKVEYCREFGRYVTAASAIKAGEVIGVEDPITFCLKQEHLSTHCLNCFESVTAGLPCYTCSQVVFCCAQCRRQATTTFHRFECRQMHLLQAGANYLALRAVTSKSLDYFLHNRLDCFTNYDDSSGTELEGNKAYNSLDSRNLFNLTSKEADIEKRVELYLVASYLLRILQQMGYFGEERRAGNSLNEQEVFIGMLLAHLVSVAESNSQQICQLAGEQASLTSLPRILASDWQPGELGFGIHTSLALFNHSCRPNTVKLQQDGKWTVLLAAEDIQPGQEICDNYGALFYTAGRAARATTLGFRCRCPACCQNWPDCTRLSSRGAAAGQGEAAGRAANSLMRRLVRELELSHHSRVISLCGEYSSALSRVAPHPHRFYFNHYILVFFCHWAKYGNKEEGDLNALPAQPL